MKVGITGVAGFIGTNLAKALLERGETVVGLDDLSYGSLKNLRELKDHSEFSFFEQDILEYPATKARLQGVDRIIHLAAFKIPRYQSALKTLQINAYGTENILKIASGSRIKTLLASTSDVYGKSTALPFQEDGDLQVGTPKVKRWAYAVSKMFEEQLGFAYSEDYHFPVIVFRFFGGYGPYQHRSWWGGPQAVFIEQALKKEPLSLQGDGLQTRTFTYVEDLVRGILSALENEKADNEVFNLGTEEEVSIKALAEQIWQLIHPEAPPRLNYIPYQTFGRYEDVRNRRPDLSKAREVLGYSPRVSLTEGLKRTILWQRENP